MVAPLHSERNDERSSQVDSKKLSLLSRLRSTLGKDALTRFLRKERPVQSPAGRLPQELAEFIIDHLWYHLDSLLACCLTCRAWVEPSRYHLFYRRRLIYEHQYKSLATLRRYGLIDYIRRIELDLPPSTLMGKYLKDMGPTPSLRALALTEFTIFRSPESTKLAQATASLVTLELINPLGASTDILRFICLFPNLDNLSVVKHSERSATPLPRPKTSPSFRGVLTLKHMDCPGGRGFVRELLKVRGGLRFHKLVLKCNEGVEPLIPACSRTLRTLFYQPRKSGESVVADGVLWTSADVAPEVNLDFYDLSKHLLLEKIETVVCSKTSIVPPTYLNHLTSKISSPNFRDLVITTHDHDFHGLASTLPATAGRVTHNLKVGVPETSKRKVTFNIEDPLWSSRDRDELVREISPVILEESESVVVVQRRNSGRVGVCYDQSGVDPMVFIG